MKICSSREIDALASAYKRTQSDIADLTKKNEERRQAVFDIADQQGKAQGKGVYAIGKEYVIGKLVPDDSVTLDEERLLKLIKRRDPQLYREVTKRVLDHDKLKAAVANKRITRKELKPFLIVREASPRLVVKLKKEIKEEHAD